MNRDLSERQARALDLLSRGMTIPDIAATLGTTRGAIGSSLHDAYRKLGATNPGHAVRIAVETGQLTSGISVELARVYRALADANSRLDSGRGRLVQAHPFGEYLLGQVA